MHVTKLSKDKPPLDYRKYSDDVGRLFEATANLLERNWPARYQQVDSARTVFFQSMRVAINTFYTIMYIVADTPKDPHRKPKFALSLPPLTRTLFEQLIAFVFMMEDVPTYIPWLFKTGYTEYHIQLEHCVRYHHADPQWQPYTDKLKSEMARVASECRLTADEIKNPGRQIGRWPTPGGMLDKLKSEHKSSPTIPFIAYVNSWLYRELSGQTHLNAVGITSRGSFFDPRIAEHILGSDWEEKLDGHLENYRQHQIYVTVTLMLAIVSEIEGHFHFGRNQTARYQWSVFSSHSDIAEDFWEVRYSKLLPE